MKVRCTNTKKIKPTSSYKSHNFLLLSYLCFQNESSEEPSTQVPNSVAPMHAIEVSPPPYHVAIMLPPQTEGDDSLTIVRDSPPPSYEKAVT